MSSINKALADVCRFYIEGFREMRLGKTLWSIILIKLFIMFFILRLFFFPNFLNSRTSTDDEKHDYVGSELINRSQTGV